MRILILNTDYPEFLHTLYRQNPSLEDADYALQMEVRNSTLFGSADFYSKNFQRHGHVAQELHVNNRWIQYAWARENTLPVAKPASPHEEGAADIPNLQSRIKSFARPVLGPLVRPFRHYRMPRWEASVLAAQVEAFKPDVILNQEITYIDNGTLRPFRARGITILGQLASPLAEREEYSSYHLIISSLPNLVSHFCSKGVRSEFNQLGFEPSVLEAMGPQPPRDIDLSFVGSLSPVHRSRIEMLEAIARRMPLKVWGNMIERLPASSPLHACYQGEAWGRDMFDVLRRSRITLNKHIDMSAEWANNMRLYEATGMGAMLLTDAKRNLAQIFTPGKEVAVYTNVEDCISQIREFLDDEPTRAKIAVAGQRKATESQTYFHRTGEILALIKKMGLAS